MILRNTIDEIEESNLPDHCKEDLIALVRKELVKRHLDNIIELSNDVNVVEIQSHEGKNDLEEWIRNWTSAIYANVNALRGELLYDKG